MADNREVPRSPPANTQLLGPMVEGITVGEWCSSPDGSGKPEAVALIFNMRQVGDVVLRLKSRRAVDEMISALQHHADSVFGCGGPHEGITHPENMLDDEFKTRNYRKKDLPTHCSCGKPVSYAPELLRRLDEVEEEAMTLEKYGVEQDDKEKTGADGKPATKCPLCGADLDNGGACPKHGTEPFEKRPEPKKERP